MGQGYKIESINDEMKSILSGVIIYVDKNNWVQAGSVYTNTIAVSGMSSNNNLTMNISYKDGIRTDEQDEAYSLLTNSVTIDGGVVLSARELPTSSFYVVLRGGAGYRTVEIGAMERTMETVESLNDNMVICCDVVGETTTLPAIADKIGNYTASDITNMMINVENIDTKVNTLNSSLNRKFEVVSGVTSSNSYADVSLVDYPDGFNIDNCVALSTSVFVDPLWDSDYGANFHAQTRVDGVSCYTDGNSIFANKPFRIVLMRTDI